MCKTNLWAHRMELVKNSEIGKLAKQGRNNGCLSFAEGVPAADLFPIEELITCSENVLRTRGTNVLQYGNYGGIIGLREHIVNIVKKKYQIHTTVESILVTTGSTQCVDLCGRVFIDEGNVILVETPSYIDAMNTFSFYGGTVQGVPCDDDGISIEALRQILETNRKVKAIYVIPDFQNPTGRYWSEKRRVDFMDLVKDYDVVVFEDNPYGEINYSGETRPALISYDTKGQVVYMGSFSKTFSPGLRVGYVIRDKEIIDQMTLTKESVDLHSTAFNHSLIEEYMNRFSYEDHVKNMCGVYEERLNTLCDTLHKKLPMLSFSKPKGGFFLWVTLPKDLNCYDFFSAAIKEKVSFVPGTPFYPNHDDSNHIRLNFTGVTKEQIEEGIQRLKKAYNKCIND